MCVTCLLSRERFPKTAVSNWMNFWWNEECVRKQFHATSFWGIVGSLYTQIHASPMLFICSTLTLSTRILVSKWMQKTKWWCLNVWLQCKRKRKWDLKKELTHFHANNTEARKWGQRCACRNHVLLHAQQEGEEGEEKQLKSRDVRWQINLKSQMGTSLLT